MNTIFQFLNFRREYKSGYLFHLLCTILILSLLISSCKKTEWYDAKSHKSLVIPSSLKDLQAILDNTIVMNRYSPSLGQISSDDYYINDVNYLTLLKIEKNAYTWSHEVPYENIVEWSGTTNRTGAYVRVYLANLVLEGLKKIVPNNSVEQSQWNHLKGQALFHRGRTFYELSQIFAPPYVPSSASSDLGIPLRLESDINLPSKRSTVEQTYDQIISDLIDAKDLLADNELPTSNLNKTRPTKTAAYAMLARVFLSMEDYLNAGNYADSCLSIYNNLVDYSDWVPVSSSRTFKLYHPEVIWHTNMADQFLILFKGLIDTTFYKSYDDNDMRKTFFFNRNNSTGLVTFKGQYSGSATYFAGLAVDEIYLIRAECLARAGNFTAAVRDINDLLRKRWKKTSGGVTSYIDQVATSPEDALKKVLLERKKELLLRGLRWSDLRRLNRDERFKTIISRKTSDGIFELVPLSFKYTLPIPDDIIIVGGMQQNAGWE